ncbi:hypothetical protein [Alicyclobacillus dauci]|uniref:Uncharacterized protein n=1 Tax=Alicyclobacillus dauci TaxID=1475485 RepID=A0ABY6Z6I9_9BACL|nr:hypothetical protein [Alicyclobacillus dauci]WAH37896.1 hypothetical protein NZD86_05185 [Alicyclobacillus dauci]
MRTKRDDNRYYERKQRHETCLLVYRLASYVTFISNLALSEGTCGKVSPVV